MFLIVTLAASFAVAALGQEDNAALIIGGRELGSPMGELTSVELFGCAGQDGSIFVDNMPIDLAYPGGVYLPEKQGVLVCGGFSCLQEGGCDLVKECFFYNGVDQWQDAAPLANEHWGLLFALGPNLQTSEDQPTRIAIGNSFAGTSTEVYDDVVDEWDSYLSLEGSWSTTQCLVQDGETVYSADNKAVSALNLNTWQVETLASVPTTDLDTKLGKCAMTEIDGQKGKARDGVIILSIHT